MMRLCIDENVKSTYTAVSDRIGDYKKLLEDFNEIFSRSRGLVHASRPSLRSPRLPQRPRGSDGR